jgi:hypothetical protein
MASCLMHVFCFKSGCLVLLRPSYLNFNQAAMHGSRISTTPNIEPENAARAAIFYDWKKAEAMPGCAVGKIDFRERYGCKLPILRTVRCLFSDIASGTKPTASNCSNTKLMPRG